jgi:hypothetical protein
VRFGHGQAAPTVEHSLQAVRCPVRLQRAAFDGTSQQPKRPVNLYPIALSRGPQIAVAGDEHASAAQRHDQNVTVRQTESCGPLHDVAEGCLEISG